MSRIAYSICGLFPAGTTPAFDVVNGWFWQFPASTDDVPGNPGLFPFPFSLLDCVQNVWNRNQISVDFDVTYDNGTDPPVTATDSGVFDAQHSSGIPFADEQELVGQSDLNFQGNGAGGNLIFALDPCRLNIFSGDLYVVITCSGTVAGLNFSFDPTLMGETSITVASNIPSINSQTAFADPSVASDITGTLNINATSYWGYDGVFDTSSGVQLIIPAPGGL